MINFEFHNPTKVIFGKNVEAEAGKEIKRLGGHKVLVHFGGDYLQANGTLDRIHKGLTDAGLEYVDLDGVVPNPRLSLVKKGIELCKKEGETSFSQLVGEVQLTLLRELPTALLMTLNWKIYSWEK